LAGRCYRRRPNGTDVRSDRFADTDLAKHPLDVQGFAAKSQ
jgi:hypothetical protein